MEGLQYSKGHLPVYLAVMRNWPTSIVQALVEAYPEGVKTIDPLGKLGVVVVVVVVSSYVNEENQGGKKR